MSTAPGLLLVGAGTPRTTTESDDEWIRCVMQSDLNPTPDFSPALALGVAHVGADLGETERPQTISDGMYKTEDFYMYSAKVVPCPYLEPHNCTECPFAHAEETARRRDPKIFKYVAEPCRFFRKGRCLDGDKCGSAHGLFERRLHPTKFRTEFCTEKREVNEHCGRFICFFAHNESELREEPPQPTAELREGAPKSTAVPPIVSAETTWAAIPNQRRQELVRSAHRLRQQQQERRKLQEQPQQRRAQMYLEGLRLHLQMQMLQEQQERQMQQQLFLAEIQRQRHANQLLSQQICANGMSINNTPLQHMPLRNPFAMSSINNMRLIDPCVTNSGGTLPVRDFPVLGRTAPGGLLKEYLGASHAQPIAAPSGLLGEYLGASQAPPIPAYSSRLSGGLLSPNQICQIPRNHF